MTVSNKSQQGRCRGDGGKIEWKLSEIITKVVSRGQSELIGKFKMVVGDVISIRTQVMEYIYIPTGIKKGVREIWYRLRPKGISCWDCWRRTGGYSF